METSHGAIVKAHRRHLHKRPSFPRSQCQCRRCGDEDEAYFPSFTQPNGEPRGVKRKASAVATTRNCEVQSPRTKQRKFEEQYCSSRRYSELPVQFVCESGTEVLQREPVAPVNPAQESALTTLLDAELNPFNDKMTSESTNIMVSGLRASRNLNLACGKLRGNGIDDDLSWLRACRTAVEVCELFLGCTVDEQSQADALCVMIMHQSVSCHRLAVLMVKPEHKPLLSRLRLRMVMVLAGLDVLFQATESHDCRHLVDFVRYLMQVLNSSAVEPKT